jgi:tellurite resistance protein
MGRWEFRLKEVLMSNESLGDSRNALEEAFFARENAKLRQQLRDLDNTKRKKEALAAASGITNDAVLEKLAALNISSETVAALALVPLIAIAWSDGSIDPKERAAVLAKAQEEGVSQGNVSHELFERWLSERPPANLLATWKDYVRALGETMSTERLSGLSSDLSKRDSQYLGACGRSHPARHEAGTVLAAVKAASRRYAVAFGQP